jgi:hypothetical protein
MEKLRYLKPIAALKRVKEEIEDKAEEPTIEAPIKRCFSCDMPLEAINTEDMHMITKSSDGKVSEIKLVVQVCDNCFMSAREQLDEMSKRCPSNEL